LRSRRQLSAAGIQSTTITATKATSAVRFARSQNASATNAASSGFAANTVGIWRTRLTACDTRMARRRASDWWGIGNCIGPRILRGQPRS